MRVTSVAEHATAENAKAAALVSPVTLPVVCPGASVGRALATGHDEADGANIVCEPVALGDGRGDPVPVGVMVCEAVKEPEADGGDADTAGVPLAVATAEAMPLGEPVGAIEGHGTPPGHTPLLL
jgi:hypothetical protein